MLANISNIDSDTPQLAKEKKLFVNLCSKVVQVVHLTYMLFYYTFSFLPNTY